jgi:hypothetical protein
MKVEDLEDYPALLRLSLTLWRIEGARGAAVMVGAGISRSAIRAAEDIPSPPLWFHLKQAMAQELYPEDPSKAPDDALRLAEEYRVYFGQNALDDFLHRHIRDSSWAPAPLHRSLLELPWSDVLTTNYDTLLERASQAVDRSYEPVTSAADLARTRAPRIVKLHGSIDKGGPLILAAEDYRAYPQTHGAFVNFARQAFIENDLCLLGFSGDDPNFLAWAGWVRDHLGDSARRIYLIGALELSAPKRRYLVAQNIIPIDFHPLVAHLDKDQRHEAATNKFLQYLRDLRPKVSHEWQPGECPVTPTPDAKTIEEQVENLRACVNQWRLDRESYPGWLICPHSQRRAIRSATSNAPMSLPVLQALPPEEIIGFFSELIWRHRTALWPLDPVIASWIGDLADPEAMPQTSQQAQADLALALLNHARLEGDEASFERLARFIKCLPSFAGEMKAEVAHETALYHCARFDLAAALAVAADIQGKDPIWALRQAAILAECGKLEKAETLVHETLKDLQRRERLNRTSLWIQSRLAYFEFIVGSYRHDRFESHAWNDRYRAMNCDPWREIDVLTSSIAKAVRDSWRRPDVGSPRFDAGSSVTPTVTLSFGNYATVEPIDELAGLFETAGVPPRLRYLNLFNDERIDAHTLKEERNAPWLLNLIRYLAGDRDALLDRYLSRLVIATLPDDDAATVTSALIRARNYWLAQMQGAPIESERYLAADRLKSLLQVLARFVIRLPSAAAYNLHSEMLGLILDSSLRSPLLFEPLELLLRNSYAAIAPDLRPQAAQKGLALPLPLDSRAIDPLKWIGHDDMRAIKPNANTTTLIDQWLAGMEVDQCRNPALHRLITLRQVGHLSDAQNQILSERLWGALDAGDPPLPRQQMLYPFSLADIPKPDRTSGSEAFRKRIFAMPPNLTSEHDAISILYTVRSRTFKPTCKQAKELFDVFCAWRSSAITPDRSLLTPLHEQTQDTLRHVVGLALSDALTPFLSAKDQTGERALALWNFVTATSDNAGLGALTSFTAKFSEWRSRLSGQILKGFLSSDSRTIRNSYHAIQQWVGAPRAIRRVLPPAIIDRLVMMIEVQTDSEMAMLLDTMRQVVAHKMLQLEQQNRLEAALEDLLNMAQYNLVNPKSKLAVDISLVRCEAVRLCRAMREQGNSALIIDAWLREGSEDILPEVRYCR